MLTLELNLVPTQNPLNLPLVHTLSMHFYSMLWHWFFFTDVLTCLFWFVWIWIVTYSSNLAYVATKFDLLLRFWHIYEWRVVDTQWKCVLNFSSNPTNTHRCWVQREWLPLCFIPFFTLWENKIPVKLVAGMTVLCVFSPHPFFPLSFTFSPVSFSFFFFCNLLFSFTFRDNYGK